MEGGLQGGSHGKVFRGGRSAKNGEPLRVRKPRTGEQIAQQVGKVVEKLLNKTEKLSARPTKRAYYNPPGERAARMGAGLVFAGRWGSRRAPRSPPRSDLEPHQPPTDPPARKKMLAIFRHHRFTVAGRVRRGGAAVGGFLFIKNEEFGVPRAARLVCGRSDRIRPPPNARPRRADPPLAGGRLLWNKGDAAQKVHGGRPRQELPRPSAPQTTTTTKKPCDLVA